MSPLALVLLVGGVVAVVVGWWRMRGPLARYRQLQETEANLRRYDAWRGNRSTAGGGPTGADTMRQLMRQRVIAWGAVIVVGVILMVAAFAVR
jgi:hypothetical protein